MNPKAAQKNSADAGYDLFVGTHGLVIRHTLPALVDRLHWLVTADLTQGRLAS